MRWVRQEDAWGCGPATLAMLTGLTYREVRDEIDSQDAHGHDGDWSKHGVSHHTLDRFLISRGFYLQRIYRHMATEWPPRPWSPHHFAQVEQPSRNTHFVVMEADGGVLDPMREGRFSLTDWPDLLNVVGLVRP